MKIFSKVFLLTLLSSILLFSCSKDNDDDTFNVSATTWKGSHVQGGGTVYETYVFNADGSFEGTTDLNGQPQAMKGSWSQDRLKVSVSNVSINMYSGVFRIQGEISADHTTFAGAVQHTTNSTAWNVTLTKQ